MSLRSRKPWIVGVVSVLSLVALSACASGGGGTASPSTGESDALSLNALVKAAQAEGEVTFYSAESDDINKLLSDGFTAKYGIKVNTVRLATGPLIERFSSEEQAGSVQSDVLEVATPEVFKDNPKWFLGLSPDIVPSLKDYPKGPQGWEPYGVAAAVEPQIIQYNTDLVTAPPKSWKDLTNPKYKGAVLLNDPRGVPAYMGWAKVMLDTYGPDYLKKIAALDYKVIDSGGPGAQQVAAGNADLDFPASVAHPFALMQQGAPLNFVIPTDPETGAAQIVNVVKGAAHPNAARLFVNYRISAEAQTAVCTKTPVRSLLPGVKGCEPLSKSFVLSPVEVFDDQSAVANLVSLLGLK